MVGHQCEIPDGYHVHHINGDRTDNRLCNLELINKSEHISNHLKGVQKSEEHRKKLSASQINDTLKSKKVGQYTEEGELVKIWYSMREAERIGGFNHKSISLCCEGKQKKHKGFKWKCINDDKRE